MALNARLRRINWVQRRRSLRAHKKTTKIMHGENPSYVPARSPIKIIAQPHKNMLRRAIHICHKDTLL